jgi:hypothetical protein
LRHKRKVSLSSVSSTYLLSSERSPAPVHFGLRNGSGRDQTPDACLGQAIAVASHAVLKTSGFKPPLTAKPPIVFSTFSLAGFGNAGRQKYSRH